MNFTADIINFLGNTTFVNVVEEFLNVTTNAEIKENLDVGGNITIGVNSLLKLTANTTAIICSGSVNNGSIMYDGIKFKGCNGTAFFDLI